MLLLSACGVPEPQALILGEPVWQSGERSVYRVTNREGDVVGTASLTITAGDPREGAAWVVTREVNDIGITELATVQMRPVDGGYLPLHSRMTRTTQQGSQIVEADYERSQIDIALTNRSGATVYERVNVPSDVRDERTLLPLIRTLPLASGYATAINSFLPITGRTQRNLVWVTGSETVTVPAGMFETWRVNVRADNTTTRVWIAKEAPHPVVKFVDGGSQATFELVEFAANGG